MRPFGLCGMAAAFGLVAIAVVMGGDGSLFWSVSNVVLCVGLTLSIGIASFGVGDLQHALSAVAAPASATPRDAEVIRGLIAPLYASGMIGTLIGMVKLLATLEDPSVLGAGTSVALLTVLYSLLGAEFILRPVSRGLEHLAKAGKEGGEQP